MGNNYFINSKSETLHTIQIRISKLKIVADIRVWSLDIA